MVVPVIIIIIDVAVAFALVVVIIIIVFFIVFVVVVLPKVHLLNRSSSGDWLPFRRLAHPPRGRRQSLDGQQTAACGFEPVTSYPGKASAVSTAPPRTSLCLLFSSVRFLSFNPYLDHD